MYNSNMLTRFFTYGLFLSFKIMFNAPDDIQKSVFARITQAPEKFGSHSEEAQIDHIIPALAMTIHEV